MPETVESMNTTMNTLLEQLNDDNNMAYHESCSSMLTKHWYELGSNESKKLWLRDLGASKERRFTSSAVSRFIIEKMKERKWIKMDATSCHMKCVNYALMYKVMTLGDFLADDFSQELEDIEGLEWGEIWDRYCGDVIEDVIIVTDVVTQTDEEDPV
jgi:hypothetical protein